MRDFYKRSNTRGFLQLGFHLGLLGITGTLVYSAAAGLPLVAAMAVHGVVVVWLFAPLHEGVHYTPFRTRWLNELVASFAGAAILRNSVLYRHFHLAHHRFCQDPQRDPELARPKPETLWQYVVLLSGFPYWWAQILATTRVLAGRFEYFPYVPAAARPHLRRSMTAMVAMYTAAAAYAAAVDPVPVLTLWIIPAMLGQPFLRGILLAEHTGCPYSGDNHENTRTTLTVFPLRLLMWNMSFHAAHHVNPAIPFHALPAADRAMGVRVTHRSPGYLSFHRAYLRRLTAGAGLRRVTSES
jgi:fatty acid desaturase